MRQPPAPAASQPRAVASHFNLGPACQPQPSLSHAAPRLLCPLRRVALRLEPFPGRLFIHSTCRAECVIYFSFSRTESSKLL
jgi:hypothetical protein